MANHLVVATAQSSAPRDVVWNVIAEVQYYSDWGIWSRAELEREGAPDRQGVGAIRKLTKSPVVSREEVIEFEPGERLVYRLLSGLPVSDYIGAVSLSDDQGGTRITWRSQWTSRAPGMKRLITKAITEVSDLAAREAERRVRMHPPTG